MTSFLSRRRFEVLALALSVAMAGLHLWSNAVPVRGVTSADADEEPATPSGDVPAGRESVGRLLAGALHAAEGRANDVQMRIRGPRPVHEDVVVVAIDEKSLSALGLFPWNREIVARGVAGLHAAGIDALGMDIAFSNEVPDAAGDAYREALRQLEEVTSRLDPSARVSLAGYREQLDRRTLRSPDDALAEAFRAAPEVVQGVIAYPRADRETMQEQLATQERLLEAHLLRPPFAGLVPGSVYEVELDRVPSFPQYGAQTPLPPFAEAGNRFGMFNVSPDPDGVIRRLPLFARLERPAGLLPSLVLQTATVAAKGTLQPEWSHVESRLLGARIVGVDGSLRRVPLLEDEPYTLVNYYGKGAEAFPHVSFVDAAEGRLPPGSMAGKVGLVGVTYVGGFDQRVTPFSEYEPGVYVHASLLSNVLDGAFLRRPVSLRLWEALFMVAAALLLAFALPRIDFVLKLLAVVLLAGGWLALDQALLVQGIQVATVLPLGSVLVTAFAVIFLGYLSVDREKGQLRHAFQHYLNPSVMDQMLKNPERLKLGGEKRELSVLFSDIRGFTTLSERMSPEALVKFVNAYLTPMTNIVFDEGGTLDKYIGDAVMAFWGAPVEQQDHALRACRTAIRMQEELKILRATWRSQGLPDFDIGVGINTGPMIVGNMGSDVRFDYTVMGDAVNLASRLEGTNKDYETHVLISEATWQQVKAQVVARRLGAVRVKGKRRPVRIFELRGLGQPSTTDAQAISDFEAGVDDFAAQRFDEADARFQRVLAVWPDDAPSLRYLHESRGLREAPPGADWDGVYTATTK